MSARRASRTFQELGSILILACSMLKPVLFRVFEGLLHPMLRLGHGDGFGLTFGDNRLSLRDLTISATIR